MALSALELLATFETARQMPFKNRKQGAYRWRVLSERKTRCNFVGTRLDELILRRNALLDRQPLENVSRVRLLKLVYQIMRHRVEVAHHVLDTWDEFAQIASSLRARKAAIIQQKDVRFTLKQQLEKDQALLERLHIVPKWN